MFWFRPLFSCLILVGFEHSLCATPLTNTTEQKNQEGCEEKAHQPQQSTSTSWVVYLKHCTADKYINIAEGPKILEVQAAFSMHVRRVTLQENTGKKRTIGGSNPTRASRRAQFLCSKIRESHPRGHISKRAILSAGSMDFGRRSVHNSKTLDENRTTFFSLLEVWCLPSPSTTISQWKIENIVDSGASVHLLRKERSEFR